MKLVPVLEALVAAGATAEQLLAVVRTHEAQREQELAERREKDAERQRKHRGHAVSRDVTVTERESRGPSPHAGARPQVVNPLSSSLRSEEVVVVGVETPERDQTDDWPEGGAAKHAEELFRLCASPWLDPNKSPELITTSGRLAAWKRAGASWQHDVVPTITGNVAKRRARIGSWKFFDAAIAQAIADNRAALEIPEAAAFHAQGPPSFADREAAIKAEARRRVLEGG